MGYEKQVSEPKKQSETDKSTEEVQSENSLSILSVEAFSLYKMKSKDGTFEQCRNKPVETNLLKLPALDLFDSDVKTADLLEFPKKNLENSQAEKPVTYTDSRGEVFEKQNVQTDNGTIEVWRSTTNKMQPDGVSLKFDEKNNVEMTDLKTGIVRRSMQNGDEITDYSKLGGGKTTRSFKDGVETINIESVNRPDRSLRIIDDRVVSYTDGRGIQFNLKNTEAPDKTADGKLVYVAKDSSGNSVPGSFTITADRSGNVVVRNLDAAENDAQYARRELNNGTIVTSSKDNSSRLVLNNKDEIIDVNSAEADRVQESPVISETPQEANLDTLRKEAEEHQLQYRDIGNAFHGDDVNPFNLPLATADRAAAGYWFRSKVNYGSESDYKSPGADRLRHPEFENFSNYRYGYLGAAQKWNIDTLLVEAGAAQQGNGPQKADWGKQPSGTIPTLRGNDGIAPYGDDRRDQEMIKLGYEEYQRQLNDEESDRKVA